MEEIRGIFEKHKVNLDWVNAVYATAKSAYAAVQKSLKPDKRLYYHTLLHAAEAALFVARALSRRGIGRRGSSRRALELAVIASLVHDSGYWRKDWREEGHEEISKQFIPGAQRLRKLFKKDEIAVINSIIDYTKLFVPVENIEKEGGLKGKMRFAGRVLGIGDTLTMYGGNELAACLKRLYSEYQVSGKAKEQGWRRLGDFYVDSDRFVRETLDRRYNDFGKTYRSRHIKEYRDRYLRNKKLLNNFSVSYKLLAPEEAERIINDSLYDEKSSSSFW